MPRRQVQMPGLVEGDETVGATHFGPSDQAATGDLHAVQLAVEAEAPEVETAAQLWILRCVIVVLPDVGLKQMRVIWHMVEDVCGGQTMILQLQQQCRHPDDLLIKESRRAFRKDALLLVLAQQIILLIQKVSSNSFGLLLDPGMVHASHRGSHREPDERRLAPGSAITGRESARPSRVRSRRLPAGPLPYDGETFPGSAVPPARPCRLRQPRRRPGRKRFRAGWRAAPPSPHPEPVPGHPDPSAVRHSRSSWC